MREEVRGSCVTAATVPLSVLPMSRPCARVGLLGPGPPALPELSAGLRFTLTRVVVENEPQGRPTSRGGASAPLMLLAKVLSWQAGGRGSGTQRSVSR